MTEGNFCNRRGWRGWHEDVVLCAIDVEKHQGEEHHFKTKERVREADAEIGDAVFGGGGEIGV